MPQPREWPEVTVSLLAYRDVESIAAAVSSVLEQDYPGDLDVHVREQGDDDVQFELITSAVARRKTPGRKVTVERGENIGFAPGHNRGIRAGTGAFVLLVNADAKLSPDFVTRCVPYFDDPGVAAVQPKLLRRLPTNGNDPIEIDTTGLVATRRRLFLNRGHGQTDQGQYEVSEEVFGADGAVPMYRRAALDDVAVPLAEGVEYLDETFFIYKCDVDLAWRLRLRGWSTQYAPDAVAAHARTMQRDEHSGFRRVLAQRRGTPAFGRYLSFGNHRVMQIKNESLAGLGKALVPWLVQEAGSWVVFLVTDRWLALRAVWRFLRTVPVAVRKRRWIQARRAQGADPYVWFR
ncbi:MAG: hypothetical protein QOE35_329 [Actinomycetota bacterium]|jgi:GT2 family glycosyltransferase